jgi:hypothetical protein
MVDLAVVTYQIARNIMQLELEGLHALSILNENIFLKFANRAYENIPS